MKEKAWMMAQDLMCFVNSEKAYRKINRFLDMALLVGSVVGLVLAAEFYMMFLK